MEYVPKFPRLAFVILCSFLTAVASGCASVGTMIDSLNWTKAIPARADLVGEWRPSESMESTLREEWKVRTAPLRIVLEDDGTATVDGFGLLRPETSEWDAARKSLQTDGVLTTSRGTWAVAVASGGHQNVSLVVGKRIVSLRMWCRSPPYSLSAPRNLSDPNNGGYLFFLRHADDGRRSALAPETDVGRDPTAGDGFLEVTVRIVLAAVLFVVTIAMVVTAGFVTVGIVIVAMVIVLAVFGALAAGTAFSLAATSAAVGLARRSLTAGLRTFATIAAAVSGAVAGTAAGWAGHRILNGPTPSATNIIHLWVLVGLLLGTAAGGLAGRFLAIAIERVARIIVRRVGLGTA